MLNEDIRTQTTERIGRSIYNTKTNTIEGFATDEQLYNHYNFDPVVFAWNMDPKTKFGMNPYSVFGDNPVLNVDPNGDAFWESSNVRQARLFAKTTGGQFHKWKGANGKKWASVQLKNDLGDLTVTAVMFPKGKDRTDMLTKAGAGFYEKTLATSSGSAYVRWLIRSWDAYQGGRHGEFDRNSLPPTGVKVVVGTNPMVGAIDNYGKLVYKKDIYGEDASTPSQKALAIVGLAGSVLGPISAMSTNNGVTIIGVYGDVNDALQTASDAGLFDKKNEDDGKLNQYEVNERFFYDIQLKAENEDKDKQ